MYDMHFSDTKPVPITIRPGLVVCVDPRFEAMRLHRMAPLLQRFANVFKKRDFPYRYPHKSLNEVCFNAAAELRNAHQPELTYCEGIALFNTALGPCALAHGWCCDKLGFVVDPTMHAWQNTPEVTYFGIAIDYEYHCWWQREVGYWGVLDGHHSGEAIGVYHDASELWLDRQHKR